jgi:hypothetical protein
LFADAPVGRGIFVARAAGAAALMLPPSPSKVAHLQATIDGESGRKMQWNQRRAR